VVTMAAVTVLVRRVVVMGLPSRLGMMMVMMIVRLHEIDLSLLRIFAALHL